VGVDVVVSIPPLAELSGARRITNEMREALVRIVQESVNNAGRHGHANTVWISMAAGGPLSIVDDGEGFDPTQPREGRFGLVSMRERAERLGARLTIESAPGDGTKVEVSFG
jgi:signal transduction histidine kinase